MMQVATWPAGKPDVGRTMQPSPWSSLFSDALRRTTVTIRGSRVRVRVPKATPPVFNVGTLFDDRLRLREPLTVKVEQEENLYVAKCEEFEEFGYGNDPMTAVDDLRGALAELYWMLKEEQGRLGPTLAELWVALQETVEER